MNTIFAVLGMPISVFAIFVAVALAILAFEITMFINVLRNRQISDTARILWAVGMVLLHPFVAIAYFFTDRQQKPSI